MLLLEREIPKVFVPGAAGTDENLVGGHPSPLSTGSRSPVSTLVPFRSPQRSADVSPLSNGSSGGRGSLEGATAGGGAVGVPPSRRGCPRSCAAVTLLTTSSKGNTDPSGSSYPFSKGNTGRVLSAFGTCLPKAGNGCVAAGLALAASSSQISQQQSSQTSLQSHGNLQITKISQTADNSRNSLSSETTEPRPRGVSGATACEAPSLPAQRQQQQQHTSLAFPSTASEARVPDASSASALSCASTVRSRVAMFEQAASLAMTCSRQGVSESLRAFDARTARRPPALQAEADPLRGVVACRLTHAGRTNNAANLSAAGNAVRPDGLASAMGGGGGGGGGGGASAALVVGVKMSVDDSALPEVGRKHDDSLHDGCSGIASNNGLSIVAAQGGGPSTRVSRHRRFASWSHSRDLPQFEDIRIAEGNAAKEREDDVLAVDVNSLARRPTAIKEVEVEAPLHRTGFCNDVNVKGGLSKKVMMPNGNCLPTVEELIPDVLQNAISLTSSGVATTNVSAGSVATTVSSGGSSPVGSHASFFSNDMATSSMYTSSLSVSPLSSTTEESTKRGRREECRERGERGQRGEKEEENNAESGSQNGLADYGMHKERRSQINLTTAGVSSRPPRSSGLASGGAFTLGSRKSAIGGGGGEEEGGLSSRSQGMAMPATSSSSSGTSSLSALDLGGRVGYSSGHEQRLPRQPQRPQELKESSHPSLISDMSSYLLSSSSEYAPSSLPSCLGGDRKRSFVSKSYQTSTTSVTQIEAVTNVVGFHVGENIPEGGSTTAVAPSQRSGYGLSVYSNGPHAGISKLPSAANLGNPYAPTPLSERNGGPPPQSHLLPPRSAAALGLGLGIGGGGGGGKASTHSRSTRFEELDDEFDLPFVQDARDVVHAQLKAEMDRSLWGGKRIAISYNGQPLNVKEENALLRESVGDSFAFDASGKPTFTILLEPSSFTLELVRTCDTLVASKVRNFGGRSSWQPTVISRNGEPEAIRIRIGTAGVKGSATYTTGFFRRRPFGLSLERLAVNCVDPSVFREILPTGSLVDVIFSFEAYDFQGYTGVRLLAHKITLI
ncbi:hypothetical protein CBR_g4839 [Chara braunii]|uniref:Uncharacterized protein n=1 Tax=Chara braunii TaxID=69332 RepID=A0A388KIZ6_CHABU|nr:hypothetical protein CBR_g4839 [Chara braunii]|eukprot:GBG70012.1 hypothetical protein CBR_g4839 [Chara braunii]